MLTTTDAIVLSLQPQSDKAHVLHAYTRAGGRVNYKVYGLGRKNAIGMYMPLSIIQITANYSPSKPPTIKEVCQRSGLSVQRSDSETVYQRSGLYKQTIRLFIAEVLYHVLRHPMVDEPMYDFIAHAVEQLDQTDEPQNFHLLFLIDFASKLGFEMEKTPDLPRTRKERQDTLNQLCAYFAEHVETWQNPKSLDILMEVFD